MLTHISNHHATKKISKRSTSPRNVDEQGVLNALDVQPQGEVTTVEFREAIWILSQVVTHNVRKQREARQ